MATVTDYPIGNCDLVTISSLTLQADDSSRHLYPGIVCLPGQRLLLVDFSKNDIRLYNRQTGDILAKSKELYPLWDVCSVDEEKSKVAVTLRNGKIQIMSIIAIGPSPYIKSLKVLKTPMDSCRGVSSIPKQDKLVVCGMYQSMQCWCVVSTSNERVGKLHEICENGGFGYSYVVASESGKCVYISCFADKSIDTGVYGYVLKTGDQIFAYKRKDLSWPRGICVDKRGLIYVCNQHLDSRNIHQLTENGDLVMIFRLELPPDPQGMCLDLNQEQIFITLWGKNQISNLRLVWRGHAETAQSTDVPVRTRDGRTPAAQYRKTLGSNRSAHDREIFTQADQSTSEASTMGCFGCFGTRRVSKHNKKAEEQYNKRLDKDENRLAHRTWKDQERTTQSDNDSQTHSLEIGDPSLHDVPIEAREPISRDVDARPDETPKQTGLENKETAQGAKNEIVETPKERPCQRTQESSDSETDSSSDDSISSEASNDSPVDIKLEKTKSVRTGKNSETAIMSSNSGIVSIGGSSNSKIIQLNFVEKTNKKKRRKKKSRSYHYE